MRKNKKELIKEALSNEVAVALTEKKIVDLIFRESRKGIGFETESILLMLDSVKNAFILAHIDETIDDQFKKR